MHDNQRYGKASYISSRNKSWLYILWSLTSAAVKLSLFQDSYLSNSIPHWMKCRKTAQGCQFGFFEARFLISVFFEYFGFFGNKKKQTKSGFFQLEWLGFGKTLSELQIHYKSLLTRLYVQCRVHRILQIFTVATKIIDINDEKQMYDNVIPGKYNASKDWNCIISMFRISFHVYLMFAFACFMYSVCLKKAFWLEWTTDVYTEKNRATRLYWRYCDQLRGNSAMPHDGWAWYHVQQQLINVKYVSSCHPTPWWQYTLSSSFHYFILDSFGSDNGLLVEMAHCGKICQGFI